MNPDASTTGLINLLQFTSGRRLFAYGQVLKLLTEQGVVRLREFVDEGVQKDRDLRSLEASYRRKRASDKQPRGRMRQLDQRVDRTVGALYSHFNDVVEIDPGSAEAVTAESLTLEFFPEGAAAVTRLAIEDELSVCWSIVERAQGELASDIAQVHATLLVNKLEQHVRAFGAELEQLPKTEGPTWDTLCARRIEAQSHLLRFVAKVWADDELTDAQRATLLAPILSQNEAISAHHSRRRSVPDVDPDTGNEVDDDADQEAQPETQASATTSVASDPPNQKPSASGSS